MTDQHVPETISDIVLRLARRELAEEMAPPLEPFFEPAAGGDAARPETTQQATDFKSQIDNRKLQNDDSSNLQFAYFNSQFAIPTPPDPPLRRGGDDDIASGAGNEMSATTRVDTGLDGAPHDPVDLSSTACDPALPPLHQEGLPGVQLFPPLHQAGSPGISLFPPLHQAGSPGIPLFPPLHQAGSPGISLFPPLRKGGSGGVSSDAEGTANPPLDDAQPAADQGTRRLMDAIDDHGARFEQVLGDLEQSLSELFSKQIEILNHLGDTARQHERRWLEQSTTRRATFSSP